MNSHITDDDKCKYLQVLAELNRLHAKIFTLEELSNHFDVSVRKLSDFKNGKVIDFWLLAQYAAIIGKQIKFDLI